MLGAKQFAHRRTRAGTNPAERNVITGSGLCCPRAHGHVRPGAGGSHSQVKEHRTGDNGYLGYARGKPHARLFEGLSDAGHGIEPPDAPPGEHDGMNFLDQVLRAEQLRLPGSRRSTPDIDPGDRPVIKTQYRDAGTALWIGRLTHGQTRYVDGASCRH